MPMPMSEYCSYVADKLKEPIPVAAPSKTWVCGLSLAETVGSNPPGAWLYVFWICCMLSGRAGHSPIEVLPSVVCPSVISKPQQWESLGPLGLSSHEQKFCECWLQKETQRKVILAPTNMHYVDKYFNQNSIDKDSSLPVPVAARSKA